MLEIGRVRIDQSKRGFTLIEMLVVLAVSALISALVFPALDRALDHQRFRGEVHAFAASLNNSRALAIREGANARFVLNTGRREFGVVGQPQDKMAEGINISGSPTSLIFFGDGSSVGGSYVVTAKSRSVSLQVDAATGKISVRG
jgi:prepilin-type N-terminal cleavage/methylation domain-containing protein